MRFFSNIRYFIFSGLLFILDLYSKDFIDNNLTLNYKEQVTIINDFFYLSYFHNYGAAFSFFSNKDGNQILFFSLIAILVVSFLIKEILKKNVYHITKIAYSLIIAGAIGNLYDRIVYGYVIDFIDIYIFKYDFAVFNIADVCIFLGVFIFLYFEYFIKKRV